jgi:hypothetical protein
VGPGEGEAAGFGALYGTASVEQDTVDLVAGYHRVRDGIVQSASWKISFFDRHVGTTYTTKPCDEHGTETDTLMPCSELCSFNMAMLRWISASDLGAFIAAAPKYVTPANIVQSWSTSET